MFTATGKQVLLGKSHYADATTPERANRIVQALNFCAIEDAALEDEMSEAISDSIDMDWSPSDGARACVKRIKELAAVPVAEA
jgi:hypothetical protein